MLTSFRLGVIVVALFCMSGGVAAADPVPLSDVTRFTDEDVAEITGWHLSASLTEMTINAVPNMAATAFSREGFLTATATLTLKSSGKSPPPVMAGGLSLFVQLGCQINLADGMYLGGDNRLGNLTTVRADNTGTASLSTAPGEQLNPNIVVNLKPGMITQTPLGFKALVPIDPDTLTEEAKKLTDPQEVNEWSKLKEGGTLQRVMKIQDSDVTVNSCGGPVFARFRATAQIMAGWSIFNQSMVTVDAYSGVLPP